MKMIESEIGKLAIAGEAKNNSKLKTPNSKLLLYLCIYAKEQPFSSLCGVDIEPSCSHARLSVAVPTDGIRGAARHGGKHVRQSAHGFRARRVV